jgi:hypothetical protein
MLAEWPGMPGHYKRAAAQPIFSPLLTLAAQAVFPSGPLQSFFSSFVALRYMPLPGYLFS